MTAYGERCVTLGSGGHRMIQCCCDINKRDTINITAQFEARQKMFIASDGNWVSSSIEWRWYWIHLYQEGNLVRSEGSTGWMSGTNDSYSTNWVNCAQPAWLKVAYRAVGRFQARARETPGGPYWYTSRYTLSSETRRINCAGQTA